MPRAAPDADAARACGKRRLERDAMKRESGGRRDEIERFHMALTRLLRSYQFRDRDRQTICGITVTQCYALDFLVDEARLTVMEIGSRLALNKSNASRVVDALVHAGLASRAPDAINHRIRRVEPTSAGRRLHDRITRGLKEDYAAILEPFGEPFVRQVNRLLEILADRARTPAGKRRGGRPGCT